MKCVIFPDPKTAGFVQTYAQKTVDFSIMLADKVYIIKSCVNINTAASFLINNALPGHYKW